MTKVDNIFLCPDGIIELVSVGSDWDEQDLILRVDPRKGEHRNRDTDRVWTFTKEEKDKFQRLAKEVALLPVGVETYEVNRYTSNFSRSVEVHFRGRTHSDYRSISNPLHCWAIGSRVVVYRRGRSRASHCNNRRPPYPEGTPDAHFFTESDSDALELSRAIKRTITGKRGSADSLESASTVFPGIPKDRTIPLTDLNEKLRLKPNEYITVTPRPEDRIWTTIDKVQLRLGEMEDRHLLNCLEGKFGFAEIRQAMEQVLRNRATLLRARAKYLEVDLDTVLGKVKKVVKP
jgi:hypothetical protein